METVGQRSQGIVVGLIIKLLVLRCRSEGDANPVAEVPRPAAFLLGEDSCTDKPQYHHTGNGFVPDDRQDQHRCCPEPRGRRQEWGDGLCLPEPHSVAMRKERRAVCHRARCARERKLAAIALIARVDAHQGGSIVIDDGDADVIGR